MKGLQPGRMVAGVLAASAALGAIGQVHAASSASWVSSEGLSVAVGSLSGSVQAASESSARPLRLTEGVHRVVQLQAVPQAPGRVSMHLQPARQAGPAAEQPGGEFLLLVPERTVKAARIAVGDRVEVRDQAHGLEFAHGEPARVFFLALRETGLGQLRTQPLEP